MIIQPARIVVIDNDESHLKSLTDTLSGLGSACLPFHYKEDHPAPILLAGVRFIFSDLHLISDAVTSDRKQQYANIASMLLAGISNVHGPYVLIIWSEFPDEFEDLLAYFDALEPGQKPIKCCILNKNDFISTTSSPGEKAGDLSSAVADLLKDVPALSALMKWEQKVATAASKTTSTLWELCSGEDVDNRDVSLRNTFGKMAIGASGKVTAQEYPGRGVVEALSPLLSDQIEKSDIDEEFWKDAVNFDRPDRSASKSEIYTFLHIEEDTKCTSTDRGIMCLLPENWNNARAFRKKFGWSKTEVLRSFGFSGERLNRAVKNVEWYLVQMNAACDQAQNNPGLLPYCLSACVPTKIRNNTPKGGVWVSGEFELDQKTRKLFCHGRFVLGLTLEDAVRLLPKFRLRGQLLDLMIQDVRCNSARLGVIAL